MPAIQLIDVMMLTRRGAETAAAAVVAGNETVPGNGTTTSEHHESPAFLSPKWWSTLPPRSMSRLGAIFLCIALGVCVEGIVLFIWFRIRKCMWRRKMSRSRPKLMLAERVDWEKGRKERHILVRLVTALPGWALRWVVAWPISTMAFIVWFPVGFLLVFFVFRWLYPSWNKLWSGNNNVELPDDGYTGHDDRERGAGVSPRPGFGAQRRYRLLTREEYRRQLRALLMWSFRAKHNHGVAAGSLDGGCYFDNDKPRKEPAASGFNWSRGWMVGPNGEAVPPHRNIPPRRRPRSPSTSPLPVIIGQPEQPWLGAEEGRDDDPAEVQTVSMVWVNMSRSKWMAGPNGDAIPPGGVIPAGGERLKCTSRRSAQRLPWEVVNLWGISTHPQPPTS